METILSAAAAPSPTRGLVVAVSGEKGAGKSTFARYLTNSLVSQARSRARPSACVPACAYLDVDVGQPEHTVPGVVSLTLVTRPLLSPPHHRVHHSAAPLAATTCPTCIRDRVRERLRAPPHAGCGYDVIAMRFAGAINPRADPEAFVRSARELVELYSNHLRWWTPSEVGMDDAPGQRVHLPLVVNTHGWNKGLGLEVTESLLRSLPLAFHVSLSRAGMSNVDEGADESPDDEPSADSPTSTPPPSDLATEATPTAAEATSMDTSMMMSLAQLESMLSLDAGAAPPPPARHGSDTQSEHVSADAILDGAQVAQNLVVNAWHLESSATGSDAAMPPRGVRSPADLRALRWAAYLTYGLRLAVPDELVLALRSIDAACLASSESFAETAMRPPREVVDFARCAAGLVSSAHQRILSDSVESRAPVPGLQSLAFALHAAATVRVLPSAVQLHVPRLAGADIPAAQLAECMCGQLVGLLVTQSETCGHERVHTRACVGVGYVKEVDDVTGELCIVTPVDISVLAAVDALSCWEEGNDMPSTLLAQGWAGGDDFCVSHEDIITGVASARATENRKQLKRKRLA